MAIRVNHQPAFAPVAALAHSAGLGAYQKELERFKFAQAQQQRADLQYDTTLGENRRQFDTSTAQRQQEFGANLGLQRDQLTAQQQQAAASLQANLFNTVSGQQSALQRQLIDQQARERQLVYGQQGDMQKLGYSAYLQQLGYGQQAGYQQQRDQQQQQFQMDQLGAQFGFQQQGADAALGRSKQLEAFGWEQRLPVEQQLLQQRLDATASGDMTGYRSKLLQSGFQYSDTQQGQLNQIESDRQRVMENYANGGLTAMELQQAMSQVDMRDRMVGLPNKPRTPNIKQDVADRVTFEQGAFFIQQPDGKIDIRTIKPEADLSGKIADLTLRIMQTTGRPALIARQEAEMIMRGPSGINPALPASAVGSAVGGMMGGGSVPTGAISGNQAAWGASPMTEANFTGQAPATPAAPPQAPPRVLPLPSDPRQAQVGAWYPIRTKSGQVVMAQWNGQAFINETPIGQ